MAISEKQRRFLRKYKLRKFLILFFQLFIGVSLVVCWEVLARNGIINSFITSCPSRIVSCIVNLFKNGELLKHIFITLKEILISFLITGFISIVVFVILYESDFLARVIDPYLTIFNSLPKVALGPILIIWVGANDRSIILMAILISLIVSIQSIYVGFKNTNKNRIKILKSFGASEVDILRLAVIPSNYKVIINTFKINIGLSMIGVVMGEFLTSKAGIGYLILYGSQVFNLNLVMSGIIILLIMSLIFYKFISIIEKHLD